MFTFNIRGGVEKFVHINYFYIVCASLGFETLVTFRHNLCSQPRIFPIDVSIVLRTSATFFFYESETAFLAPIGLTYLNNRDVRARSLERKVLIYRFDDPIDLLKCDGLPEWAGPQIDSCFQWPTCWDRPSNGHLQSILPGLKSFHPLKYRSLLQALVLINIL